METTSKFRVQFKPHKGQMRILKDRDRFNVINCGRRFGKTVLGVYLLSEGIAKGQKIGWFSPTYKDMDKIWRTVKRKFASVIENKNETLKYIEFTNGAIIDFWTCSDIDNGRGQKYHRVIVDEVAKIRKFKSMWDETIRPTLTDYAGDAYMLSTPKGKRNDFYTIYEQGDAGKNKWKSFCMPTSSNPHISKQELLDIESELPLWTFLQEYMAQFVTKKGKSFFHDFSEKMHVFNHGVRIDKSEPLWVSLDFNIAPTTAVIGQKIDPNGSNKPGCFIHDLIQAVDTATVGKLIKEKYGNHPLGFIVTGDNSGHKGNSAAGTLEGGDYNTDFYIIQKELGLSESDFIDTRSANPRHEASYKFCNRFFRKVPFLLSPELEAVVEDLEKAQLSDTDGIKLFKSRKLGFGMDIADACRYLIHAWFQMDNNEMDAYCEQFILPEWRKYYTKAA